MFRQALRVLARSISPRPKTMARAFSRATPPVDSRFPSWNNPVPNMKNLKTETVGFRNKVPASFTCKLMLNVVVPFALKSKEVDMVDIPATTGQMSVLPEHDLPETIVELKPGVLSVHEGNDTTRYFISNGFACITPNSAISVFAFEAVPVDHIDPSLVQKGLADFTQKLSSATTDLKRAKAQIGVDFYSALNSALVG